MLRLLTHAAVLTALAWPATAASDTRAPDTGAVTRSLDQAIRARWQKNGIQPAPAASDATFLRRVTLDLVGRVPKPAEAVQYLADRSPDKRVRLVDRLLASPDYATHWADVYGDLLLGRTTRARTRLVTAPRTWLRHAFATNMRLDDMATAVITASGDVQLDGATGFIAATQATGGDVAQLAGATARLFLGVQIQCAQCHDHPYDARYKQGDFAAFAAFYGELIARNQRDPLLGPTIEVFDAPGRHAERRNAYAKVTPRFLGRAVTARPGESRRQALARHVTSSDLFGKVSVNRAWSQLFGYPIEGDTWDELGGENDAGHPPELALLARDFEAHGHDHKRLLRIIALSEAYARAARGGSTTSRDAEQLERHFARAAVRPLGPDQLFRSVLVASRLEPALGQRIGAEKLARRKRQALRELVLAFTDGAGGGLSQALLLRNGTLLEQAVRARPESLLGRVLAQTEDPARRLRWLFLAAYSREPTAAERARYVAHLTRRGNARAAYEDLFHAMLASSEFATNH